MDTNDHKSKPLYCHWDTHDQDVLFMNEDELDQHLHSHFLQLPESLGGLIPSPQSPSQEQPKFEVDQKDVLGKDQQIECHWDACHEMFNIDEIMEHFKENHQVESLKPHNSCQDSLNHCISKTKVSKHDGHDRGMTSLCSPLGSPPNHQNASQSTHFPSTNHHSDCYVRLNPHASRFPNNDVGSQSGQPGKTLAVGQAIDASTLPRLSTPESIKFDCLTCMWSMLDGNVCGEEFLTSTELNSHIVHNHLEPSSMTCKWDGCNREAEPFGQKHSLVRHLQVHAKSKDHRCNICKKEMRDETQLKDHKLSHREEKPFKCELCDRSFRCRKSLNVHSRTHTGLKPLVCTFPGCGKRFAESSNLAKHRRTHQAPEFECKLCTRKFTRRDHLTRHLKSKVHRDREIHLKITNNHSMMASLTSLPPTPTNMPMIVIPNLPHAKQMEVNTIHSGGYPMASPRPEMIQNINQRSCPMFNQTPQSDPSQSSANPSGTCCALPIRPQHISANGIPVQQPPFISEHMPIGPGSIDSNMSYSMHMASQQVHS